MADLFAPCGVRRRTFHVAIAHSRPLVPAAPRLQATGATRHRPPRNWWRCGGAWNGACRLEANAVRKRPLPPSAWRAPSAPAGVQGDSENEA